MSGQSQTDTQDEREGTLVRCLDCGHEWNTVAVYPQCADPKDECNRSRDVMPVAELNEGTDNDNEPNNGDGSTERRSENGARNGDETRDSNDVPDAATRRTGTDGSAGDGVPAAVRSGADGTDAGTAQAPAVDSGSGTDGSDGQSGDTDSADAVDDGMVTREEYDKFQAADPSRNESSEDDETREQGRATGSTGRFPVPSVNRRTILIIGGALAVGIVALAVLKRRNSGNTDTGPDPEDLTDGNSPQKPQASVETDPEDEDDEEPEQTTEPDPEPMTPAQKEIAEQFGTDDPEPRDKGSIPLKE